MMGNKLKKRKTRISNQQPLSLGGKIFLGFTYLILIIWSIFIIWPLVQMVISAFNGRQQKYLMVNDNFVFSLKHFKYLFENTLFLKWVRNTVVIGISTSIITLIMVSFTGYAYSRFRFKGRKLSLMGIMLVQAIPVFAGITAYFTMYSIFSARVPVFSRQMMLVLIYSGKAIAGNTFILKGYIDSVSTELDDAARIDGASNMQVYKFIIMPIARPMLALIALWTFIEPFMDFLLPKVLLTNPESYTLASGLFTLISTKEYMNQPAFAAGGLLTAIPIVILFLALQDELVSGLAQGSVKG